MAEYQAVWPIEDPTVPMARMCVAAEEDLAEMLEQANLARVPGAPIAWSRDRETLTARLHVIPVEPFLEDARPWMSLFARGEELGDRRAA